MGGGGVGGTLYARNGAGPSSLVNLMAKSVPIQSTLGWDHGIFACLLARCECCVDVHLFGDLSFGSQQLTRLVPRRLD